MHASTRRRLLDAARSLIGALLLGVPLLYTMETWWLGWRLPAWLVLAYSVGGLLVISIIARHIGHHKHEELREQGLLDRARDFAELFAVSLLAAVVVLALLGIPDPSRDRLDIVRLALLQVVPLGLGASLTNVALRGAEESEGPVSLKSESAVFAGGALFFALPIAPTEEMELIAAHAGAWRLAALIPASLLLTYLTLYVLELRGHEGRRSSHLVELGGTVTGYAIALAVSAALLASFGHILDVSLYSTAQQVVTLSFVASLGGAAARVVI